MAYGRIDPEVDARGKMTCREERVGEADRPDPTKT
jgi:hypothetical protein